MVYLKFLVFLYFLDCGYIHVHVLVYGQNFHKIMYYDVIRHVSPLIPDVAASIFRKNLKRVLFFLHVHFIQRQPLQSDNFFRWTLWKPDTAIVALSTCAQRDNAIKHKSITQQREKTQVDNATTR